jgi:hypothetical protein
MSNRANRAAGRAIAEACPASKAVMAKALGVDFMEE